MIQMKGIFSTNVRDVISYSRKEAIRFGYDYIGTEHLLLGLIREGEGCAIKILQNLRCNIPKLKISIEDILRPTDGMLTVGQMPLNKQAEKVLKIACLEVKLHKSDMVGTEHILLSLLRDNENVAVEILQSFNITYDAVREELDVIIASRHPLKKQT